MTHPTVQRLVVVVMLLAASIGGSAAHSVAVGPRAVDARSVTTGIGSSMTWPGPHQVALTFDDGPSQYTHAVLDALEAAGVHATFFVLGDNVTAQTAPLLARMAADDDSVQNHSRSHPYLTRLPDAEIAAQLSVTSDRIEQATGARPTCFRPPYGASSPRVQSIASSHGLTQVLWTTDTSDFELPGSDRIAGRALAGADGRPLTILMHDGGGNRAQTVAALGDIISGLRTRGYEFVTLCSPAVQHGAHVVPSSPPDVRPDGSAASGLVPRSPVRVLDSRTSGGPITAGAVVEVDVSAAVAPDAVAAMLQVTVDGARASGYASVVDCGAPPPDTSVVNFEPRTAVSSGALAPIREGKVCLLVSTDASLIVDVTGSFSPSSTIGVRATEQARLLDTRGDAGPLPAGTITRVPAPAGAAALFVNLTAVAPTRTGYLTAWPCDAPQPPTSTSNFSVDRPAVANGAILQVGSGGLCIYNDQPVDEIVDLLAVFEPGGLPLHLDHSCRLLDTRTGAGGWSGRVAPDQTVDAPSGVPGGGLLVGTLTATQATGPGFVTLSPEGGAPTTSNLNVTGSDVANFTAVTSGHDAHARATVGGMGDDHLLFDLVGWFGDP